MKDYSKRNRYSFSIGTIGRDIVYALVSTFLIVYLTEVVSITDNMLKVVTVIFVLSRIFDALNDPFMGSIVDNTHTKWGKFKPWILLGALLTAVFTFLLFTDFGLSNTSYVIMFSIVYILWGISYTINDISFWSMMPSLSYDQKEREKTGALARICANIGLFTIVVAIIPITNALTKVFNSQSIAYTAFALMCITILLIGQTITLFGVKEKRDDDLKAPKTRLKDIASIIFKNDQLLIVAIAMGLFMIGYITTTSFGVYYFKYYFKDENLYSGFAAVLGVSQIIALLVFPIFSKKFTRKQLYTSATIMVAIGYLLFFFSPTKFIYIAIAGIFMFAGQAFIQLLMLLFLADTIEYGELKLGKRNAAVSFSLQPFIYKIGGAIGTGVVGATLIISGINNAPTIYDVSDTGLFIMKFAMLIIPLILIVIGYFIYLKKFKIDQAMYEDILVKLNKNI